VDVQAPRSLPMVRADPTRLRQVLINLLSNAIKFTEDAGRVWVAAADEPDGGMVLTVADNGIGMSEAEIAVALQPFGQVENTLSRSFNGTGLGLPLARRLIELHGGELRLSSVKGEGTEVSVRLPPFRVVRTGSQEAETLV
jgi:signal transduction histidine kinase